MKFTAGPGHSDEAPVVRQPVADPWIVEGAADRASRDTFLTTSTLDCIGRQDAGASRTLRLACLLQSAVPTGVRMAWRDEDGREAKPVEC
jgi:hypothetical protein